MSRIARRIAAIPPLGAALLALLACPAQRTTTATPSAAPSTSAPVVAEASGAPLEFVLDPLERDFEAQPESQALLGKRAVVLVLTTYDVGSLMALRTLAPLLNDLPKDATCLLVALQPLNDRPLITTFMDAEKTPCRRAVGDPKRGRLGDLAKVKVVPTVLVLRADGTFAGGYAGTFTEAEVRATLEKAKTK